MGCPASGPGPGALHKTVEAILAAVAPAYAVISVGKDSKFGHPDHEVLERLAELGDVRLL